ncbi:PD-(D/E)XK nuclease family protein [Spirulina sp. 06S082]|uniref:PD-(D/E)XK nuclease family protein n=1 Tax=Spirulina sp. 06S082 TaxID=3110248 RepID=UPI002B1FC159|nr:DUF3782 domain-containing protein [Spirulina sp. 06S082]MEA5470685.1 DUF3782 domain-containing protein [Spirulina sp. 06S082]
MEEQEIKALIRQELPKIVQEDREVRDFVLRTIENLYAGKQETESRFDRILAELQRDRETQRQKWDEQNRNFQSLLEEVRVLNRKHDSTIGALGARWGFRSEESFRKALQGILQESFGVEVINLTEYDETGEVFGRPEQIELDLIIKNGLLIICEIKSSVSKADIYTFEKKVRFYQERHHQTANRKIIISPMVHPRALEVGRKLNIEVYSYAEDVEITR